MEGVDNRYIKTRITRIAASVTAIIIVIVPLIYFVTAYTYETAHYQAEAKHSADDISRIVHHYPKTWKFQENRIAELLSRGTDADAPLSKRALDARGDIIAQTDTVVSEPTVTRRAELIIGFSRVGSIEVTATIRHIWTRTGFIALLGIVLGLAMFVALRVLPLRALMDATQGLEEAHSEIGKLNAVLEQRVAERTTELRAAQAELLRKERLAAIGQVTATVGHELRNPLGAIRTALAVVRKLTRDENPMMKQSLDISDRGITRCDAIIGDLLDFTRIRELNREPTAIDRWLRTVLDEHGLPEPVRPRLELEAGIEMPLDRERLRRVVVNVIDNACHAMDANEPAGDRAPLLTVGTRVNGERLEITVRDTGHGMAPEVAAKAFEPLYSTKAFGVGLGLPMVKQIMEQHGGGVDITSQEERGTEVVLWLPLAAEARGDAA